MRGTYNYKSSLLSSAASATSEISYFSWALDVCDYSASESDAILESRDISLYEFIVRSADAYYLFYASLLIEIWTKLSGDCYFSF